MAPACQRSAIFLPFMHLPSNYIISILFYSLTMEQIPLRGPDDGAISLHPLGTLCLAQVLQFSLHPFSMWAEGVKWKLTHLQALAMEIAL